jgi:ParB-like chromosome segregation protein Spo0J
MPRHDSAVAVDSFFVLAAWVVGRDVPKRTNGLSWRHPITVAKRDGGYRLLAGAQRLTAFRELGMERISANIVEQDDLHAELVELDENLARNELSPAERSAAVARRKAIYETLHPETKHGAIGKGRELPKGAVKADRFSAATAAATGRSERAIQLDAHRGEVLGGETLAKVARTSLDRGTELDALAKLPVAERQVLVDRAAAGEVVTAQAVPAKPPAVGVGAAPAQPIAALSDDPNDVLHLANALLAQADGLLNSWQKLYERNDDASANDGTLAKAFIVQADIAIAAASYLVGPVTDDVVEKARNVVREWQDFLRDLEAERPILDEDAA